MSEIKYFETGILAGYHVGFTVSPKAFKAEMKRLGVTPIPSFLLRASSGATTHFFSKDDGNLAIITLNKSWKSKDRNQVSALIAHEVVHVWQDMLRQMNETNPGDEIEAYAIQTFVQGILYELYPE